MVKKVFVGTDRVGDIVTDFPGASRLLKQYRIDFCCGGDRPLSAVLKEKNMDQQQFLLLLNEAFRESSDQLHSAPDWRRVTYSELIDHVVLTHHAYLKQELPLLSEFVVKISRVHGANHPELAELNKLFQELKRELEQHLVSEEEAVFPYIKTYEQGGGEETLMNARNAVNELEAEHEQAGSLLQEMREVTRQYQLPDDACRTYTLTFRLLEELEEDMFQHIHLENNILFPRLEAEVAVH